MPAADPAATATRTFRHAYFHGFASSPTSRKGGHLARAFRRLGVPLERPDLNVPSFARLTVTAMLSAVDDLDARTPGGRWRIVGSSLGAYLATLWALSNPGKVDRLVLLCPAFDMEGRWPGLRGADEMRRWREDGSLALPDATGRPVEVHWGLYEDLGRHPAWPSAPCPVLVIHGTDDEVVPVESSRAWVARHPGARLIEVPDDHLLGGSLDLLVRETMAFFDLAGAGDQPKR